MFSIDLKMTDLKVTERNLHKVLFSMNIHLVAAAEQGAEDAKSYVFFFKEGGKFVSYVGLYFVASGRTVYYSHSSNPFSENELPAVEDEARGFTEEMGAMLDELGLSTMSDQEKDRWIAEQDIFSPKKKIDEPSESPVEQTPAAEQSAPVIQPAPTPPPMTPEPPPVSRERTEPVRQVVDLPGASTVQPEVASPPLAVQSIPASTPAAAAQPPVRASVQPQASLSRPQRTKAAASQLASVERSKPAVQEPGSSPNVTEQTAKAGAVKAAPKAPIKKDVQNAGVATREKEALARLLASF